jgi:hypothetical protein
MEDSAMLNIKWLGRIVLAAAVTLTAASPSRADEYVHGYYRSNGTYVQPYFRSDPDGNPYNNYSYPGNLNPYTGQVAPRNPVPAENSESGGKSLVFGFTDAIWQACLSLCDRSFLGLDADSVVWRLWS